MKLHETSATNDDSAITMARQALYRFAALTLLDPRAGSWKQLDRLRGDRVLHHAAAFLRRLPNARTKSFGLGDRTLEELDPAPVLEQLPASAEALNAEYEATFGLLVSSACPPYESEYIDSKFAFQRSNSLADISGFYRAFGLEVSAQYPERPDHIVLELEFMAHLLSLEQWAEHAHPARSAEYRQLCRDAQSRFLTEHLGWWASAFARLMARQSSHGFYGAAGAFLAAFIPTERALLRIPPVARATRPTVTEPDDLCAGCAISGLHFVS
jgi:TorA maturation chaperone TorD